jgi:hypothetical protein
MNDLIRAVSDWWDGAWPIFYLGGYVALLAWTRRADFKRRATLPHAAFDVVGGICLSVPALAWMDERVARLCGDPLLRLFFAGGLIALAYFTWDACRKAHAHPLLPEGRRRILAGITLAAAVLGAGPDIWWGMLALSHAARTS